MLRDSMNHAYFFVLAMRELFVYLVDDIGDGVRNMGVIYGRKFGYIVDGDGEAWKGNLVQNLAYNTKMDAHIGWIIAGDDSDKRYFGVRYIGLFDV